MSKYPDYLKQMKIWVLWKRIPKEGHDGKLITSVYTGRQASSKDPSGWASFDEAEAELRKRPDKYTGLGIAIPEGSDLVLVDVDNCRKPNGEWSEIAQDILQAFKGQYIEQSQSGSGLHVITRGRLPEGAFSKPDQRSFNNQEKGVEMYFGWHFLAMTGNTLPGGDNEPSTAQEAIEACLYKYRPQQEAAEAADLPAGASGLTDEETITRASMAKNGEIFRALYFVGYDDPLVIERYPGDKGAGVDPSAADAGLMELLAWWTERNPEQMESLFNSSALVRGKWDGRPDYRERTIRFAVSKCKETRLESIRRRALEEFEMTEQDPASGWHSITLDEIYQIIKRLDPHENPLYKRNDDIALSYLFGDVFEDVALFEEGAGRWYCYDGVAWRKDERGLAVAELAKLFTRAFVRYASECEDEQYTNRVIKLTDCRKRAVLVDDARGRHKVKHSVFDADPYLFNVRNGVINLRTGELLPHDPALMLSKVASVTYCAESVCPEWVRFIADVMEEDTEKVAYLQEVLGAALMGSGSREEMYMLYGSSTRNGKSTLLETISALFGEYGKHAQPETLALRKKDSRTASGDLARLEGCRFLHVAEPQKDMILDTAQLKQMTGRDTITARFLHEGEIEFVPVFSLFVNTNYLPLITDDTVFSSDRIRVIEFKKHIPESKRDPHLKERLQTEESLSGILNWLIEGLKRYQMRGETFILPEDVIRATGEYRNASDKLGIFLQECFTPAADDGCPSVDAYELFNNWCRANGYGVEGRRRFNADLRIRKLYAERMKITGPDGGKEWSRNVLAGYTINPEARTHYHVF